MVRGFTILEILLYVSILSTGLGLLTSFYYISGEIKTKNEVIIEVNNLGSEVINLIRQEIDNSIEIKKPGPGQSTDNLTLVNGQNEEVLFVQNQKKLDRIDSQVSFNLLNNVVFLDGITFTTVGNQDGRPIGVGVNFNLRYYNPSGRNEYNYSQSFNTFILKR